ncbi:uncharacterized protein LOC123523149 isoform X2 [Mercenaria mercenaria]|uniref:uncharacterized protein LOC123523149 isoform X2 n=1 Tax=Mercenaria mercenaria TaxID=6596 RepID=UPI00234EEEE5|nr:uncharacterized protein LOC123523149 isoform X2 [Mercenaria mercenaria]
MKDILTIAITLLYIGELVSGRLRDEANVEYINNETTITTFDTEQIYRWIIEYPTGPFVRIVFTNVSLENNQDCSEKLLISRTTNNTRAQTIDHRYNGRVFVVETSETNLTMTFLPCPMERNTSRGFRAIITKQDVPACVAKSSVETWMNEHHICDRPTMMLTSMSILNFPFLYTEETWEIVVARHHTIHLHFTDFYMECFFGGKGDKYAHADYTNERKYPKFAIKEYTSSEEKTFCITDILNGAIKSKTEHIVVIYQNFEPLSIVRTEGFRLQYSAVNHSLANITDSTDNRLGISWPNWRSGYSIACSETYMRCYTVYPCNEPTNWDYANKHCKTNNLRLVSVQSKYEMKYINYVLRDFLYNSGWVLEKVNYTAHIGLRYYEKNGEKKYIWENTSPVTFSAWKQGHPKAGKECTRINFLYVEEDTWESEHCTLEKAQFIVCMSPIEGKEDTIVDTCDDTDSIPINVTYSGKVCQRWDRLTEEAMQHFEALFPNQYIPSNASNNCLDPSSSGIFGCYIEGLNNTWEPCVFQLNEPLLEGIQTGNNQSSDNLPLSCRNSSNVSLLKQCDWSVKCNGTWDEILCFYKIKGHHLIDTNQLHARDRLPSRLVQGSFYRCGSMEWISILAKCDGVIDCIDASDELHCERTNEECGENEFSCGDGNCIHISKVCDFISDCSDSKDEFCGLTPCENDEYRCDTYKCISEEKRCNAIPDCVDFSDERTCDIMSCKQSFHCDGFRCISKQQIGNSIPDCEDGSDEKSYFLYWCSCDEMWKSGYHSTGYYQLGSSPCFCNFTSIGHPNGEITATINIDETLLTSRGYGYYTDACGEMTKKPGTVCYLKMRNRCKFAIKSAFLVDDQYVSDNSTNCQCSVWTYRYIDHQFEYVGHEGCNGEHRDNISSLYDPLLLLRQSKKPSIEITPETITCIYDYRANVTDREFNCDNEKSIPMSLQCVYDEDGSGYMTGCRSGSHLHNCTTFVCPENTVKCPQSYCIPLKFVCDGKVHCPTGEDELNCTCSVREREVIIIVEDTNQQSDSKTAAVKLAEQFYSPGSIIRLLHFKKTTGNTKIPIKHELLEIREERVIKFRADTPETNDCIYGSMARNLLHILRFSRADGVLFIEDSVYSSSVADLMFSNLSRPSFFTYRVIKTNASTNNKPDRFRFVKDIRIIRWEALFSIGYRRFPEICEAASVVPCSGGYRCSSSQQCIPLEQICDGIAQCSSKDDEQLCDFSCPYNCSCSGYSVSCRAANIKLKQALALPKSTRSADISLNPEIYKLLEVDKLRLHFLVRLNVSSCRIRILSKEAFAHLNNLVSLDIGYNEITRLPEHVFSFLRHLRHLILIGNVNIRVISSTAFHGLENINSLQITGTKLERISAYTFSNLTVKLINISYNRIQEIEDFAFNNISIQQLDMRGNEILIFNKHIFRNVTSLRELRTPAYKFCCIRPCYVKESECYPKRNEFSSCEDLMRHPVLQAVLWIVGVAALAGNLGSIIYRLGYDRARLKIGYGIFVTNLATADFLMGVYLITIAVVDSYYRDRYIFKDEQWRNSKWCVTAGILSTVSSEASVLFVCLITLDRLLVIKYPFGTVKIGPKKAHIVCCISWIFAISLALVPIIFTDIFQNRFYSRSGVCIALPLTRDKPPGWMYSVAIFVGLNFCTFILVGIGQLAIFIELRKATSTIKKTERSRKKDLKVARNLILVATTDFLCWFPIGVMGIMALSGYPISGDAYAWTAVFLLPLNSALNPVLYTLTAIIGKQKFNPSTEEQNRTELQKETGSAILQFYNCGRSMGIIRGPSKGEHSVQDVLTKEGNIPAVAVAAISLKLSKYLTILLDSSIAVAQISERNTYIRMDRKKKQNVRLALDWKLSVVDDKEKIQNNIYEFGILLRRLTSKRNT